MKRSKLIANNLYREPIVLLSVKRRTLNLCEHSIQLLFCGNEMRWKWHKETTRKVFIVHIYKVQVEGKILKWIPVIEPIYSDWDPWSVDQQAKEIYLNYLEANF